MSQVTEKAPSTGPAGNEKQATAGATPPPGEMPGQSADQQEGTGATPAPTEGESTGLAAALKAERDARRQAEAALKKLQEQQTQGLSESERLAHRVAELEAANKAATIEALRLKISQELSIPPALASRLHGSTEAELRADAEALKQAIPAPAPTPTTPGVGGPQGPPAGAKSPEEWVQALRARRR